jgi:hypothetical protein
MIVVLASRRDRGALRLVDAWHGRDVRILTPNDLSQPGWVVRGGDPGSSRLVVGGNAEDVGDVTGVVTRLPTVAPGELARLHMDDRHYASREISAFLGYWLSTLTCPVLNPPGTAGLCGPGWRDERWLVTASRLGIDVVPRLRRVPKPGSSPDTAGVEMPRADFTITVVGDRCVRSASFGAWGRQAERGTDDSAAAAARLLAATAGVPMVTVGFAQTTDRVALVGASAGPDVSDPDVRDAMLGYLEHGPAGTVERGGSW